ncbi:adenylate/guanylate cyclase domain-containing protein [Mucilaginibacter sp. RS28]|uniref:Adenylate/guanylate cyclase domain-containing protein n=1 Tax=Mucilaginibacter straminoryzae TaxID=2932774 RepID=A0A9X2BAC2_9SPHI|nr:adenylate/guanylate cyclase domain-containing protein [Mucilaginibacter straminoryzae]MCJ8210645.1 adenylate/guanylate cyclase domain-containing protein [Mucilaginibacter straminoryzae]
MNTSENPHKLSSFANKETQPSVWADTNSCQYLTESFALLKKNSTTIEGLPNGSVEKELAIVFLDVRNFTGLMEARPVNEVIQLVRWLFKGFTQIINSFNGRVVEIAGDSLYAVFGLATTAEKAINDGYQAVQRIFETMNWFNAAYTNINSGYPLEIGVGLHTGNVVVGEVEFDAKRQLSVMGLPVNIAARLQSKTKEVNNDWLISEQAYQYLDHQHSDFKPLALKLQGISAAQQVRLAGKPYQRLIADSRSSEMDYIMAISG